MKKVTLSSAKKKAWKQFSLWIRLSSYAKNGGLDEQIQCFTCDKWYPIKNMSAGHGIGGRNNAVLFDERIVKPQCVGCNIWGRGQYQVFTRKLIAELGLDVYDEIVKHSSDVVKYRIADYQSIEEFYKLKLAELNIYGTI